VALAAVGGTRTYQDTTAEYDFVVIPFAPASSPTSVVAYVTYGTVTLVSGPDNGSFVPLASATYLDTTTYVAGNGNMVRSIDPEKEAQLFSVFFPNPSSDGSGAFQPSAWSGRRRSDLLAPGGFLQVRNAEVETCPDPRVKNCTEMCQTVCIVAATGLVMCNIAILLVVGVVVLLVPPASPGTIAVAVAASIAYCGAAVVASAGCLACIGECRDYNRAVCAQWNQLHPGG
jgi:hypothetical protein